MDAVYQELASRLDRGERLALAVLVESKGSTPQKAGAKAIFLPDGQVIGTLGGGCLEAETQQRALRALDTGSPISFRVVLDDDFGWDDGLICGGSVRIFIQPNPTHTAVWEGLRTNRRSRRMLVTLLDSGARALFEVGAASPPRPVSKWDARPACPLRAATTGTVVPLPNRGGDAAPTTSDITDGALLCRTGERSVTLLNERNPQPRVEDDIFYEPILPNPVLTVCGAGHLGEAVAKLAAWCGFDVTVIDDRQDFANRQRFPDAREIVVADGAEAIRQRPIDEDTYIALVTRGHRHDALILREVIHSRAAYIGMIGSKRKLRTVMDGFIKEGVATAEDFRRVHSPMGVPIGSSTVEEIAVSVVAEMIAVRRGARDVPSLSATGRQR